MNRVLLILVVTVAVSRASFGQVAFTGLVLDSQNRPSRNVQVWAQLHTNLPYRIDNKDFFQTRTDSSGRFALTKLPSGEYHIAVTRIEGVDDLTVDHIQAQPGDVWRLDYRIARRMTTIRKENSNLIRRFEYLGSTSKEVIAGGSWEEATNGIPQWKRECAELRAHPTIVSHGVVLCAKHRIPLITERGYRTHERWLIHTWGLQLRREECNPNYISHDQSLKRHKDYRIPTMITYCPRCEDAVWLTENENRRNLNGEYGR